MSKESIRVLVVDDEPRYIRAIRTTLQPSGYAVFSAPDGQTAIQFATDQEPDLILLDIRLPDLSGYEVCRQIREFSTVPIIMLTALAETDDKIKGLEAGADDYVTKPFSAGELLARVRAALRRIELDNRSMGQPVFRAGNFEVDFNQRLVRIDDRPVRLTPTEYRLLCEMINRAGQVLVPAYLLEKVWGEGYEVDEHLVYLAIHRLRRKIERDPDSPQLIQNRPGMGYLFVAPHD